MKIARRRRARHHAEIAAAGSNNVDMSRNDVRRMLCA
jgi:hypothetical protein